MELVTRQPLIFTLVRWATAPVESPARKASIIRRLATDVPIVTLVALRLWTLLTTTTLGLRCRTECSVEEKASFVPLPIRIRPILPKPVLIGLLIATTPIFLMPNLPNVAHNAADPLSLAGFAMRTSLPGRSRTRLNPPNLLLGNFRLCPLKASVPPRVRCTMIPLLQMAGSMDIWTLHLRWLITSAVWLLRGWCPLETLSLSITPTSVTSVVRRSTLRCTVLRSMLLIWNWTCIRPLTGLTRTLSVSPRIVRLTTRFNSPITGVRRIPPLLPLSLGLRVVSVPVRLRPLSAHRLVICRVLVPLQQWLTVVVTLSGAVVKCLIRYLATTEILLTVWTLSGLSTVIYKRPGPPLPNPNGTRPHPCSIVLLKSWTTLLGTCSADRLISRTPSRVPSVLMTRPLLANFRLTSIILRCLFRPLAPRIRNVPISRLRETIFVLISRLFSCPPWVNFINPLTQHLYHAKCPPPLNNPEQPTTTTIPPASHRNFPLRTKHNPPVPQCPPPRVDPILRLPASPHPLLPFL